MHDLSPEKIIERVKAVEARARIADIPMNRICALADVSYSTWQRWRSGETSPVVNNLYKVETEAEKAIAAKRGKAR